MSCQQTDVGKSILLPLRLVQVKYPYILKRNESKAGCSLSGLFYSVFHRAVKDRAVFRKTTIRSTARPAVKRGVRRKLFDGIGAKPCRIKSAEDAASAILLACNHLMTGTRREHFPATFPARSLFLITSVCGISCDTEPIRNWRKTVRNPAMIRNPIPTKVKGCSDATPCRIEG